MISKYQPERLYISADGPRANNSYDTVKTEEVKDIFHKISWECEVFYNYSVQNQGCKLGCHNAISLVFLVMKKLASFWKMIAYHL
ncbi:MAG: hypothetical protein IPN72_19870 [Saprospiraceae bacterium]|nr:hypothetical protein [Saprospiraceae bacterium]